MPQPWKNKVIMWQSLASMSTQVGILKALISSILSRFIWANKCKSRMENVSTWSVGQIIHKTCSMLVDLSLLLDKPSKLSTKDIDLLLYVKIPVKEVKLKKVKRVSWQKPKCSYIKLNIDSCYIGNPGLTDGGICRDEEGHILVTFAKNFGADTNDKVEVKALLEGCKMCFSMGCNRLEIDT